MADDQSKLAGSRRADETGAAGAASRNKTLLIAGVAFVATIVVLFLVYRFVL